MRKNTLKLIIFGFVITFLASCASPYKIHLNLANPEINSKGNAAICISSIDQREYILSKEYDPRVIATTRGGFGNIINIHTKSGKPVSDDISMIFKEALMKNGYKAETVVTVPSADSNEALNKMKSTAYDKYIMIKIKQLKLDILMTGVASYSFKFEIEIYDKNMRLLGSNTQKFEDSLGTVFILHQAFDLMVARVKIDIEQLMNNEKIKAALK